MSWICDCPRQEHITKNGKERRKECADPTHLSENSKLFHAAHATWTLCEISLWEDRHSLGWLIFDLWQVCGMKVSLAIHSLRNTYPTEGSTDHEPSNLPVFSCDFKQYTYIPTQLMIDHYLCVQHRKWKCIGTSRSFHPPKWELNDMSLFLYFWPRLCHPCFCRLLSLFHCFNLLYWLCMYSADMLGWHWQLSYAIEAHMKVTWPWIRFKSARGRDIAKSG